MHVIVRKIGWMASCWLVAAAAGCSAQKPPAPGTFIPAISIVAAQTKKTVPVTPTPTGKHGRTSCPTDGWVTHGDGHKTRCPLCDPPWEADVTPRPVPPVDPVPPIKSYDDAVKAFDDMCATGQCNQPATNVRRPAPNVQESTPERRGIFGRRRGR